MFLRSASCLALAVLMVAGVLSACDEDDGLTGPQPFRVTLEVTDPDGQPVAGLELGMVPDSTWYMDGRRPGRTRVVEDQLRQPFPNPFFPAIRIPFALDRTSWVLLTIEDIEGTTLRTLVDAQIESGERAVTWDSRQESRIRVLSSVYAAHLVVRDLAGETVRLDESRRMLLAVFTADQGKAGTTDGNGRIILEDKRLFPFLYDIPAIPAMDENGTMIGAIALGPTVRFYFTEPGTGVTWRYDRDVLSATSLRFVWDPDGKAR